MNPTSSHISPGNHYRLDIVELEINMSHWIDCPFIYDNRTNDCILHLGGLWKVSEVAWDSRGEKVDMTLHHHADGSVTFRFEVDLEGGTATLSAAEYGNLLRGTIEGVVEEMARTTELRTIFY